MLWVAINFSLDGTPFHLLYATQKLRYQIFWSLKEGPSLVVVTLYLTFFVSGLLGEAGEENPGQELEQDLDLQVASTSGESKDSKCRTSGEADKRADRSVSDWFISGATAAHHLGH